MHTAAEQLSAKYGRRVFVMAASGILPTATWDEYLVAQKAITADVAAPRVLVVPQLHGNDLGVLARATTRSWSTCAWSTRPRARSDHC